MKRRGLHLLILLSLLSSPAACTARSRAPATGAGTVAAPPAAVDVQPRDLAPLLEPIRRKHDLPALAAAVVTSRGGTVSLGAAGVRRYGSEEAVEITDRFCIGSCTKSMTAAVLAMLVDEGKLTWDTTLAGALPELAEAMRPEYRTVTLVQLLGHRGGLRPFLMGKDTLDVLPLLWLRGTPAEQRRTACGIILAAEPVAPPGTATRYSNGGYCVAGHVAETAAGVPWERLMAERLFAPLGMTSAGFGWPATTRDPHQPWGHMAKEPSTPTPPDHFWRMPATLYPSGAVHCSVGDFAAYAAYHLRGLRGMPRGVGPSPPLLRPETFGRLHTPAAPGSVHALGWEVRREKRWGLPGERFHLFYGGTGNFVALMVLAPERDLGIVVATNSGAGEPACDEVAGALLRPGGLSGQKSVDEE